MAHNSIYLDCVFDNQEYIEKVQYCAERIIELKKEYEFDSIAFTGISGAALAFPLSFMTKTDLICVRKKSEDSHFSHERRRRGANYSVEGKFNSKKFIIIDDCCASGLTIRNILRAIDYHYTDNEIPTLMGIVLYYPHKAIKGIEEHFGYCLRLFMDGIDDLDLTKKFLPKL